MTLNRKITSLMFLLIALATSLPAAVVAQTEPLAGLADLPPGERYRQLSLLLMLADGADTELLDFMSEDYSEAMVPGAKQVEALQDYPTPLARIADPETMLTGTGQMMRFAREHRDLIKQELTVIEESWPILVSMIDMNAVREDAIIIRSAVADSLQYQPTGKAIPEASLLAYQDETVRQRNDMEYLLFKRDLDQVTDSAIDELSYKLDAYQRMADEELDPELARNRIDAAENMNQEARDRYREQAYIRASTLYLMLIPAMVTVITD